MCVRNRRITTSEPVYRNNRDNVERFNKYCRHSNMYVNDKLIIISLADYWSTQFLFMNTFTIRTARHSRFPCVTGIKYDLKSHLKKFILIMPR